MTIKTKAVSPTKRQLNQRELDEAAALKAIFRKKKRESGNEITYESVSAILGISLGAIGHYLNGVNALNAKIASAFAMALGVSVSEFSRRLAAEIATMATMTEGVGTADNAPPNKIRGDVVPLLPMKKADIENWLQFGSHDEGAEWLPKMPNNTKKAFAVTVSGDAMVSLFPGQRSYPDGTIIFVDPLAKQTIGKGVVAILRNTEIAIFRLLVEDSGKQMLRPINAQYSITELTADDVICGVVVGSYHPE
jgi:SOS-response transcriptional repressor LexA